MINDLESERYLNSGWKISRPFMKTKNISRLAKERLGKDWVTKKIRFH
jgi:hypothetical protein